MDVCDIQNISAETKSVHQACGKKCVKAGGANMRNLKESTIKSCVFY